MRKVWIGCGLVAAAVVAWLLLKHGDDAPTAQPATATAVGAARTARPDPRKLERARITGAITDEATHQPIAHARICADGEARGLPGDLLRDPRCTYSDDAGRYALADLYAARYTVGAMAKGYRPDFHYTDARRTQTDVAVAAGAQVADIDIALRGGGVAIHGTITDVTGGTIARAQVRASSGRGGYGPSVESDDQGQYELWVRPGHATVSADADGYAAGAQSGRAPGKLDVVLTPESSLAGTVVDATSGAPVANVKVGTDRDDATDLTDAAGHFTLTKLNPGRFVALAHAPRGYGKSEGSIRVGLGQHVDGVVIKLWPAQQLVARIVVGAAKQPCADPEANLEDTERHTWVGFEKEADGTLTADGVLPGTYKPHPVCHGMAAAAEYPKVVVDGNQGVLEWRVDPGAAITGAITTKSGAPVDDADVTVRLTGGTREDMQWQQARTDKDGRYRVDGLNPGTFKISVSTPLAVADARGYDTVVAAGATATRDIVLDDGGSIRGTVTDSTGAAIADVEVRASASHAGEWLNSRAARTDESGAFHLDQLSAGEYRVTATRGWFEELRKPGTTDDAKQGEKTVVRVAQTSVVALIVEAQTGTITGSVVDAQGQPVSDAFVAAARESDAAGAQASQVQDTRWFGEDHPVVSGLDGAFALKSLSPGKYTLRAYRKGGGEAIAEHVALGSKAALRIKPTASIAGTVTPAPEELTVSVNELKTGLQREESFYRTNGVYAVADLPAGHYIVIAKAKGGHASTELDLADDQQKTGVDFALAALAKVTGRFVDAATHQPVPGIMAFAMAVRGGGYDFNMDSDQQNISDADGRFTIANVARGQMSVRGFPRDWEANPYGPAEVIKQIDGDTDVGDLPLIKNRVKPGDPVGELGLKWAQLTPDTPPEAYQWKVSYIDPQGPAVKSGIAVGDVVVSCDGTDIGGANAASGYSLMQAPPGTTLKLGLASGKVVAITLAAP